MKHPFYATALLLLISLSCCKKNGETIPVYDFTYIGTGYSYSAVTFSPVVPANATCYWQFGDGTTSTERSPAHVYKTEDTFLVTLIVNNDSRYLVSKKLTIQSTVKRINGSYQSRTGGLRHSKDIWPVDHASIIYTTNWLLSTFDITTQNDTLVHLVYHNNFNDLTGTFYFTDSLSTDSTLVFIENHNHMGPYLVYDHKNEHIFFDNLLIGTSGYTIRSYKVQ